MVKIATWNVNSIKARLPRVLEWLSEFQPDIALLQELKCVDEAFPETEINDAGYNVVTAGQKTYNGVAILSKTPIEIERTKLPGDDKDEQARYIEAIVSPQNGNVIRIASIYLPNGNPTRDETGKNSDKYLYKLAWMDRLCTHVRGLLTSEDAIVFGGDYNIVPRLPIHRTLQPQLS